MTEEGIPSDNFEQRLGNVYKDFYYGVAKATFSLVQVLAGLERLLDSKTSRNVLIRPSYLDVFLNDHALESEPDQLCRGGDVEQFAYRAWMVEVIALAEKFRAETRKLFREEDSDSILPETSVLGDLNKMRNDIVHNKRIASREKTGKCELLRWFDVGEAIVLDMRHVLDFLNHLGLYGYRIVPSSNPLRFVSFDWLEKDELLNRSPTPRAISVRVVVIRNNESEDTRTGIVLVYENGLLCPLYLESGQEAGDVELCDDGRLLAVPGLGLERSTDDLYYHAVRGLVENQYSGEFGGPFSPWYRIRR